jgi:hypothetical protein
MNIKMSSTRLAMLLPLAGTPLACSGGGSVNIGETQAVGSKLSDYAASWDGYAEAFTFMPSGSDRIRVIIDANGQGTLQLGDATPYPPPTDPNVGYPPGVDSFQTGDAFIEGVLYPVHAARVQTERIQLGLKPRDLYAPWCMLQTPVTSSYTTGLVYFDAGAYVHMEGGVEAGSDGGLDGATDAGDTTTYYNCVPTFSEGQTGSGASAQCTVFTDQNGTQSEQINCGKYAVCVSSCACTATSCTARPLLPADAPPSQYPAELDAALDSTGMILTGTLNIPPNRVTVHLQKH